MGGGASSAITCGAMDRSGTAVLRLSGDGPVSWSTLPFDDYPFGSGKTGLVKPDLCAPGADITSCDYLYPQEDYTTIAGSSPATGAVAGCLALLAHACLRAGKPIVSRQIEEALEKPLLTSGAVKLNHVGAGLVNVYSAFLYGKQKQWWS